MMVGDGDPVRKRSGVRVGDETGHRYGKLTEVAPKKPSA